MKAKKYIEQQLKVESKQADFADTTMIKVPAGYLIEILKELEKPNTDGQIEIHGHGTGKDQPKEK